jgi:hypothetical protein
MKKFWLAAAGALLLMCLSVGVASAQAEEPVTVPFCGDLTEHDCAALGASAEAMAGLTSGSSVNEFEVYYAAGAPSTDRLAVRVIVANEFVTDAETLARMAELKAMTPAEFRADAQVITDTVLLPLSIDRAQAITVSLSPDLSALIAERFEREPPTDLTFHTRVIDNVLYLRLADYAAFGLNPERVPEWIGVELAAFMPNVLADAVEDPDLNVEELQTSLAAPGAGMASSVVYRIPPTQTAWYNDFMLLTVLGDTVADGQAAQRYLLQWDIPRYLGGPLFAEMTGSAADGGYPNAQSRLMGSLGTVVLDGLSARTLQTVGRAAPYVYDVETRVEWALGLPGGGLMAERPTIGVVATTANRNLNAVEAIPVPDEALTPPLSVIMQLIQGMRR